MQWSTEGVLQATLLELLGRLLRQPLLRLVILQMEKYSLEKIILTTAEKLFEFKVLNGEFIAHE